MKTEPLSATTPWLPYSRDGRRRPPIRAIGLALVIAALFGVTWTWRQTLQDAARRTADLYRQRGYLAFARPADTCVYDGNHPLISADAATNGWPSSWPRFMGGKMASNMNGYSYLSRGAEPLVFLHARIATKAGPRLIAVWRDDVGVGPPLDLAGESIVPGTLSSPAQTVGSHAHWALALNFGPRPMPVVTPGLKIFAGQPDPADASHLTIRYTLNGRPGTVDGWVNADGVDVTLIDRSSSAALKHH